MKVRVLVRFLTTEQERCTEKAEYNTEDVKKGIIKVHKTVDSYK
jgi:hypothetical protein